MKKADSTPVKWPIWMIFPFANRGGADLRRLFLLE